MTPANPGEHDRSMPNPGTPNAGGPDPGTPTPGTPNAGGPDPGTPTPGTPVAGPPTPGTPVAGPPTPGTPVAGKPSPGKPDPDALELAVIQSVRGVVLEIGPGTGVNFDDFPDNITWIGLEPDDDAVRRLRSRARKFSRQSRVIEGVAENIPLDDHSVDTVLSTLVLCSVEDQARVLSEIKRVLKPGGRFAFFEHVAARPRTITRLAQRISTFGRRRKPGDCDPLRDTLSAIRGAFPSVEVTEYSVGGLPGLRMPHIAGWASDGVALA